MPLSEQEFRAWTYRNGGETYDRPNESEIAHRFPEPRAGRTNMSR